MKKELTNNSLSIWKKTRISTALGFNVFFVFLIVIQCGESIAQSTIVKTAAQIATQKKLGAAVEAQPENLETHNKFIAAWKIKDSMLSEQYDRWIDRFPKSHVVPFAIGQAYADKEDPKAKGYLLKALERNPNLAEAWFLLAIDALRWGDEEGSSLFFEKAKKAAPKNADYAYYYGSSLKNIDSSKHDSVLLDISWRFPESERAAFALYTLASNASNSNEASAYFTELNKRFPSNDLYLGGMGQYYELLIKSKPYEAFKLALSLYLAKETKNRNAWKERLKVAKVFLDARSLLNEGKPGEAVDKLKHLDLGSPVNVNYIRAQETLTLFRAEAADAANQTQAAYDSLTLYYTKAPSDTLRSAIQKYGAKLGIDKNQIDKDVWKLLDSTSKPATDFSLDLYLAEGKASLADYKGKVVLLTYWFPGCGPCRAEFPHFESVVKKFQNNQVAYLGINALRDQDEYVVPFMKSSGYSFTPLAENPLRDQGNLSALGYPTNYLLDQEGRIIFSDFRIYDGNTRMLELMIEMILNKSS